jgi:spermidine synthase
MDALGRHILVEYMNCEPEALNDVPRIESSMVEAATRAGATVINSDFHHFSPYGVSGVVIIEESHLAIHTWPEYQYAAVDLFTCGDEVDPWIAFDHVKEALESKNYSVLELHRGPLNLLKRIPFNAENFRQIVEERLEHFPPKRSIWFTDKDENVALSIRARGKLLYDKSSDYQRTRVFDSYGFGKVLTIDNMVMCTERDESHYHEMICHPAIFAHGNVKDVLVIGGGDGGTVRDVLKHESIESVTMVEIDANVVEASKEHLPTISSAFDHAKLDLKIEDGIRFVKNAKASSYDLILIDGSDPVGPAKGLFSEAFYRNCQKLLREDGILVTQGESPAFNREVFVELNRCLKSIFPVDQVHVMLFHIFTYPTGLWSFQMATKNSRNILSVDAEKIDTFAQKESLKYYNSAIHQSAFALPTYVQDLIKSK